MAGKKKSKAKNQYLGKSKRSVDTAQKKILEPNSAEAKAVKNQRDAAQAKREGRPVQAKPAAAPKVKKPKVLIAYFSWGGTTRKVAQDLKKRVGADMLEITVDREYSKTYLMCVAQAKKDALLGKTIQLTSKVPKAGVYDVLLLGFPIWWFGAPVAVDKFLEAFDTSGVKVYPFATSKSSQVGVALDKLKKQLTGKGELGEACTANDQQAIDEWLQKIGL